MSSKVCKSVLILVPTIEEYRYIREAIAAVKHKLGFATKVVMCGVGKVNAAQTTALELQTSYDLVVSCGYCGSSQYEIGQLVNPRKVVDHRIVELKKHGIKAVEGLDSEIYLVSVDQNNSVIYSTDSWIASQVEGLVQEYCSYDMETFAIAQVASELGVPVTCVKVVSNDTASTYQEAVKQYNSAKEYITSFEDMVYLIYRITKSLKS